MMMAMLGILITVALSLGAANAASLGTVYTEGGMVEGEHRLVGYFRYMDVFRGIPFAAKPGTFEKPVPHPGWDGVLRATSFKSKCMQVNLFQTDVEGSEDCLYLNIWVPQGSTVSTDLPVMVFIYGGAFLVGSAQGTNYLDNYLYSGEEIADRGNVIVVTLNYRVGTLGFLSSGDADAPGNYGLWDQHAGIAWVHRNIKYFGGDPDNITVFGESAGGASVNFQILSPHNKGLIRRAISQSGVAVSSWAVRKNPREFTDEVARRVGCPTDAGMVACLKMTDAKSLTLAGKVDSTASPSNPIIQNMAQVPVVDGDFLPDDPGNLFHNAADIDYIAGINDMDGHSFAMFDIPSIDNIFDTTSIEELRTLLTSLSEDKGPEAGAATFGMYTYDWAGTPSDEDIKKRVVEAETDYIFLVPTQSALYLHINNANTAKTYSYLFSEPNRMPTYPVWMGADHADDLQYVFGKPFSTPLGYFPWHRDLSGYMIAYWTNFARTGNPNQGELDVPVLWPEFTNTGHQYLEIHHAMNSNYVHERLRTRFVYYWTTIYASFPSIKKD